MIFMMKKNNLGLEVHRKIHFIKKIVTLSLFWLLVMHAAEQGMNGNHLSRPPKVFGPIMLMIAMMKKMIYAEPVAVEE